MPWLIYRYYIDAYESMFIIPREPVVVVVVVVVVIPYSLNG